MQKLAALPVILLSFALSGCNNTLDFRNAEISNNKIYETGKNTGFSGKITNIPLSKIPFGEIVPITNLIGKVTGNKTLNDLLYLNSLAVVNDGGVLCDTASHDGVLNGDTTCKIATSGNPVFKFTFKNNAIDGDITFFYADKNSVRLATTSYAQGKANGLLTIYGFATGNPIYKLVLENSIGNGKEEAFDEKTGKVIFEGNLVNGKYEGGTVRYNADGSVTEKLNWRNGEILQASTNSAAIANSATATGCLDAWVAAFHKEQGPDAAISAEQIDEWKVWCSQGKTPAL